MFNDNVVKIKITLFYLFPMSLWLREKSVEDPEKGKFPTTPEWIIIWNNGKICISINRTTTTKKHLKKKRSHRDYTAP